MTIESVRISESAKRQLVTLKRRTKIAHWNILCRWAFCKSLSDPSSPIIETDEVLSNVEMTWKTFGGRQENIYYAALLFRFANDLGDAKNVGLSEYFAAHLRRGIVMLASPGACTSTRKLLDTVNFNKLKNNKWEN